MYLYDNHMVCTSLYQLLLMYKDNKASPIVNCAIIIGYVCIDIISCVNHAALILIYLYTMDVQFLIHLYSDHQAFLLAEQPLLLNAACHSYNHIRI